MDHLVKRGRRQAFFLNPIFVSDCLKQPSSGETVSSERKVGLSMIDGSLELKLFVKSCMVEHKAYV